MSYTFEENLDFGNKQQNIAINYLCNVLGYKFVGGDINGKSVGTSEIERICKCKHISIKKYKGACLQFKDNSENDIIFTMPDELLFNEKKNKYRWTEIKSSRNVFWENVEISKKKIEDYYNVGIYSGIDVFIVFVAQSLIGWNGFDLYYFTPREILYGENEDAFEMLENSYKIYIRKLQKINKEPIQL